MKNIILISLLLIAACTMQERPWGDLIIAQKYVPGTEDLPVYSGFQPIDTKNVVFDSESGRIVDASYFSKNTNLEDVRNFYVEALPQLGWKKNKSSEYIREGESLKVSVTDKNGVTYLKFTIRPIG